MGVVCYVCSNSKGLGAWVVFFTFMSCCPVLLVHVLLHRVLQLLWQTPGGRSRGGELRRWGGLVVMLGQLCPTSQSITVLVVHYVPTQTAGLGRINMLHQHMS